MTAAHFDGLNNMLCDRRPFELFTIEPNGGERFEIDHPRAVINRDGAAIFIGPGFKVIWFELDSVNKIIEGRVEAEQV